MKFATVSGRACVGDQSRFVDLADASGGAFGPEPADALARWAELREWFASTDLATAPARGGSFDRPVPQPGQVFGIGVNYADHAAETGFDPPKWPLVFAKFASCISAPEAELPASCEMLDWEVELVVVIGRLCRDVAESEGWDYVAGLTVGQDISDRELQFREPHPAQFNLGKSRRGFGPIGPWIVTPDEFADPDDLAIGCELNGEGVQGARTREMIFGVGQLISYLSSLVDLLPGDLIFTGTPAGVGMARTPQRFLRAGDMLTSTIEGIGTLTTRVVADGSR